MFGNSVYGDWFWLSDPDLLGPVEPRLFELKSLFPGNEISWTETKLLKQARKFEDAFAETGPRKEAGQFGANHRVRGNLPLERECVVADAVTVEPVSATNSLVTGK